MSHVQKWEKKEREGSSGGVIIVTKLIGIVVYFKVQAFCTTEGANKPELYSAVP
jgi:hypothetical protein